MIIGSLSWYFAIIYPTAKENNTKSIIIADKIIVSVWALTNWSNFDNITLLESRK